MATPCERFALVHKHTQTTTAHTESKAKPNCCLNPSVIQHDNKGILEEDNHQNRNSGRWHFSYDRLFTSQSQKTLSVIHCRFVLSRLRSSDKCLPSASTPPTPTPQPRPLPQPHPSASLPFTFLETLETSRNEDYVRAPPTFWSLNEFTLTTMYVLLEW